MAEFGDAFRGYIVEVADEDTGVEAKMTTERRKLSDEEPGMPGDFSNFHHVGEGTMEQRIRGAGPESSRRSNEAAIDAYTKVLAEGARWDCVARLGPRISDRTRFYRPNPNAQSWSAVTFERLWSSWKLFDMRFHITDAEVVEMIQRNPQQLQVQTITDRERFDQGDYNLDTSTPGPP